MNKIWKDGMWGLIVADALGVPVEFKNRDVLKMNPVTDLREFGTHHQPKGTWSDDSSMALATLDSIKKKGGINFDDIMTKFTSWYYHGKYTPEGKAFDIGIATRKALSLFMIDLEPLECGGIGEKDNGNGSLMRILPVCLYLYEKQKTVCTSEDESIYYIHGVSKLTHGHLRSQIACGIYYFMVKAILEGEGSLRNRLQNGIDQAYKFYRRDIRNYENLNYYNRLIDLTEFIKVPEEDINSSGYVVATLEAAIWCLLNTDNYKDAVLKAVNLGDDTDTVGAVAGGLAGLYYGYEDIPEEWLNVMKKKDWIDELLEG